MRLQGSHGEPQLKANIPEDRSVMGKTLRCGELIDDNLLPSEREMPGGEIKVTYGDMVVIIDADEYRKVVTAWRLE